ncbi:MAG: DUF3006 domain-containing protein [Myxococcales bacterium]|nr:DUF3006 domain-containing protein [Myxococcales bacterium]
MSAVVVDRIEGPFAVLLPVDGDGPFDVPLALLPPDVAEGQVLEAQWKRRPDLEAALRAEVGDRLKRLTADDDGGDFDL